MHAECLFIDPVGDIAVLGEPDNQSLAKQAEAYYELVDALPSFRIGDIPRAVKSRAWLLSLAGNWFECVAVHHGGAIWIENAAADLVGGMSGGAIVSDDNAAIGGVTTATFGAELDAGGGTCACCNSLMRLRAGATNSPLGYFLR